MIDRDQKDECQLSPAVAEKEKKEQQTHIIHYPRGEFGGR